MCLCLCSESDELDAELAGLASHGFTGCLSAVRFNSITPLKAALLHSDSPVIVTGPLVQSSCGTSSPAKPYAAETTHSLSGARSRLCPYIPSCTMHISVGNHPALLPMWESVMPLVLFLGLFIRLFMGSLTILLGKQTERWHYER